MVDVGKNLSPVPFPSQGKGEKEERGLRPLSKIPSPSPLRALYQKSFDPCHPRIKYGAGSERSEGSRGGSDYQFAASPAPGFFVASLLRMTFDTRLL